MSSSNIHNADTSPESVSTYASKWSSLNGIYHVAWDSMEIYRLDIKTPNHKRSYQRKLETCLNTMFVAKGNL